MWNAERFSSQRREKCWPVGNGDNSIEWSCRREYVARSVRILEAHRDRMIPPRIFQYVATIRRQRDIESEPPRRVRKHARLVTGGRCYQ